MLSSGLCRDTQGCSGAYWQRARGLGAERLIGRDSGASDALSRLCADTGIRTPPEAECSTCSSDLRDLCGTMGSASTVAWLGRQRVESFLGSLSSMAQSRRDGVKRSGSGRSLRSCDVAARSRRLVAPAVDDVVRWLPGGRYTSHRGVSLVAVSGRIGTNGQERHAAHGRVARTRRESRHRVSASFHRMPAGPARPNAPRPIDGKFSDARGRSCASGPTRE